MNTQATPEIHPQVAVINGEIKTNSIVVAKHFDKRHADVLRAIENLDCSPNFRQRNFALTAQTVRCGAVVRKTPAYEMTKDGFTFLAMGFTGKEAAKWKEAYISAFNAMAEQLAKPQPNSLTINLAPLAYGQVSRWMITQHGSMVNSWKVSNDNNPLIEELTRSGYVVFKPEDGDIIDLIYEHLPATQMPLFIEMAARRLRALPPPAPTDMTLPEAVKQHLKARYTHGDIKALCKDLGIHDQTAKRIMGRLYGKGDQE